MKTKGRVEYQLSCSVRAVILAPREFKFSGQMGREKKKKIRKSVGASCQALLYFLSHCAPTWKWLKARKRHAAFSPYVNRPLVATGTHSAWIGCTGLTFIGKLTIHLTKQRFPLDQSITGAKEITINAITRTTNITVICNMPTTRLGSYSDKRKLVTKTIQSNCFADVWLSRQEMSLSGLLLRKL